MVDPVTGGLIGWACGKLGDIVLKHLLGDRELSRQLDKVVAKWAKSLPKGKFVVPRALFPDVDLSTAEDERPAYFALQAKLAKGILPERKAWHTAFFESWRWVREHVEEPQPFFIIDESEAARDIEELVEATYDVCVQHEPVFKKAVIDKLDVIYDKLDHIGEQDKLVPPAAKQEERRVLWPDVSVPLGGPKVSEPFAGHREELETIARAMGGDKTVVAVVGMAGQGKSCLAGEWYKRGARPPEVWGLSGARSMNRDTRLTVLWRSCIST